MISLAPQNVRLRLHPGNKEEAIRAAGQVLADAGHISPGYIESMLKREEQANTYLSHGIAIPHGMPQDRELIHKTGVSVVQIPGGVPWSHGETVKLVVGIAAKSDEHLGILAALTDVLDDPNAAQSLASTKNIQDIIDALSRRGPKGAMTQELVEADEVEITLLDGAGLHARPALAFAEVAQKFQATIRVKHADKVANGKAMASLLKLGVPGGGRIQIQADGDDAQAALQALREAVAAGLDDVHEEAAAQVLHHLWQPSSPVRMIAGVSASPGLAIGRLHLFQPTHIQIPFKAGDLEHEKQALHAALQTAHEQLEDVHASVSTRSGKAHAAIFRAHQALIEDEEMLGAVHQLLQAGHGAAWSWRQVIEQRVEEMKGITDERIAARATDLHDVGQRVLRLLAGADHAEPSLPDKPVILIADDLTPSDTARLDPSLVLGLCTASGGPTSHTAIIARSLDIPAVVGAGPAVLELQQAVTVILDGDSGQLYLDPAEADLESARVYQHDRLSQREVEHQNRYQPAMLTDGHRVEVVANIGKASDAAAAVEAGAEGIGLLRTEFLFFDRESAPTEDEQYAAYIEMMQALNGLPLIVRTLDIGGDKQIPYLPLAHEENPFLGVRGIRLCLREPEMFRTQLRAIFRASKEGPLKIMFPMVATLEDWRAARDFADQVRKEIGADPVEMGIMIEVPSAVLLAEEFAREVAFFSIGTNDLTQYTLAMDRMHPLLGKHVDGLHPAVLRLIDQTVRAAKKASKWVGVCGGIAGDPLGAIILTGLGVAELSMSLPSVAAVKSRLRGVSLTAAQSLASQALAQATASEVRALVQH